MQHESHTVDWRLAALVGVAMLQTVSSSVDSHCSCQFLQTGLTTRRLPLVSASASIMQLRGGGRQGLGEFGEVEPGNASQLLMKYHLAPT